MADSTDSPTTPSGRRRRDPEGVKRALTQAAGRLLTQHAPSAISGRQLAAEAGVNYGLVHHYFGGKDAALAAGLQSLRDDFIERHGDGTNTPLLGIGGHAFLQAMVRSQVDHPDSVTTGDGFPVSSAMVRAMTERIGRTAQHTDGDTDLVVQAKARVVAAVSIQVCYSVFGSLLLDSIGVESQERQAVEAHLAALYDALTLRTSPEEPLPTSYPTG